VDFSASFLLVV